MILICISLFISDAEHFFQTLAHLCGIKDSSGINRVGEKAENTVGMKIGEKVVVQMVSVRIQLAER